MIFSENRFPPWIESEGRLFPDHALGQGKPLASVKKQVPGAAAPGTYIFRPPMEESKT
jgi:hypothetical protein